MSINPIVVSGVTWGSPTNSVLANGFTDKTYVGTGTDADGFAYRQILTVDGSSVGQYSSLVGTKSTLNGNLIATMTKRYQLYTYDENGANGLLASQYDLVYTASDFENVVVDDVSGSGLTTDPSGNALRKFNYTYTYVNYDISGDSVVNTDAAVTLVDTSGNKVIQYMPFNNFIINSSADFLNFDLLYDASGAQLGVSGENVKMPLIRASDLNGGQYYLIPDNTTANITWKGIPSDVSSGSVLNLDSSGAYVIINNNIAGSNGVTLTYVNATNGVSKTYNPDVYNWTFARITVSSSGSVSIEDGIVIIELQDVVMQSDDTVVDKICQDISGIIGEISSEQFNIGTLSNYQELITEVNAYVDKANTEQYRLSMEEVNTLEQYSANITGMSNLFGQLVIQLQSANLVDSTAVASRIKVALQNILTGIQNLKAFKLAIAEQNLLKISGCLLAMSTKIAALYQGLTGTTVDGKIFVVSGSSNGGNLFDLQEGIWYFANGLPTVTSTHGSPSVTYYRMWSNSTYYVPASYYTQFALTEKDQKDLDNAKALVTHLKDNLSKNIQIINNSTQLNDLKSSLTGFGSMSSNLLNAQLNLMQKLTLMGYKINIQP